MYSWSWTLPQVVLTRLWISAQLFRLLLSHIGKADQNNSSSRVPCPLLACHQKALFLTVLCLISLSHFRTAHLSHFQTVPFSIRSELNTLSSTLIFKLDILFRCSVKMKRKRQRFEISCVFLKYLISYESPDIFFRILTSVIVHAFLYWMLSHTFCCLVMDSLQNSAIMKAKGIHTLGSCFFFLMKVFFSELEGVTVKYSALNGSFMLHLLHTWSREHCGGGGWKIIRARGWGGLLWDNVSWRWCCYCSHELPAVVGTCTRPAQDHASLHKIKSVQTSAWTWEGLIRPHH